MAVAAPGRARRACPRRRRGGRRLLFYQGKLAAARYFFRWELPAVAPKHALLRSLDPTCLEVQEAWL
jgi:hypothetical protein